MKKQQPPQLSPQKYIQTRARKLPLYKCLVNSDWQENDMADVFVIRRHTNGHLTVGAYLIDLLCLGVKDTFYRFNEPEEDIMEWLNKAPLEEIDYNLAHNIIFAGHDYALDYGIDPVKEFALTRLILEEDTDDIPLIDVPTGGHDGKPHLIVQNPGQWSAALAALRKNAGEGGFHYTIQIGGFEDKGDFDEEEIDPDAQRLYEIPQGELTPFDAMELPEEDLADDKQVEARSPFERLTINLEIMLRGLAMHKPHFFSDPENILEEETSWLDDPSERYNGKNAADMEAQQVGEKIAVERFMREIFPLLKEGDDDETLSEKIKDFVTDIKGDKPQLLALCVSLLISPETHRLQWLPVAALAAHTSLLPIERLVLALSSALNGDLDARYADIYEADRIATAFPGADTYHIDEVFYFWATKMVVALRQNNLTAAINWYRLVAETDKWDIMLLPVQTQLLAALHHELEELLAPLEE